MHVLVLSVMVPLHHSSRRFCEALAHLSTRAARLCLLLLQHVLALPGQASRPSCATRVGPTVAAEDCG